MYTMDRGDLPDRGTSLYLPTETIPALTDTNLRAYGKEGFMCYFLDLNPHTGVIRSDNLVLCKYIRNISTVTLYAKELAHLTVSTLNINTDRYSNVLNEVAVLIDEYYPSYGCRPGDCFWAPVLGPAIGKSQSTSGAGSVINVLDPLVANTAATTGAPDAGSLVTAAATITPANNNNVIGFAQSALTTANTAADLLLMVRNLR